MLMFLRAISCWHHRCRDGDWQKGEAVLSQADSDRWLIDTVRFVCMNQAIEHQKENLSEAAPKKMCIKCDTFSRCERITIKPWSCSMAMSQTIFAKSISINSNLMNTQNVNKTSVPFRSSTILEIHSWFLSNQSILCQSVTSSWFIHSSSRGHASSDFFVLCHSTNKSVSIRHRSNEALPNTHIVHYPHCKIDALAKAINFEI